MHEDLLLAGGIRPRKAGHSSMVSYWSGTVQAPANWTNPAIGVTLNQIQTDLAGGPRWWGWAWHGYLDGKWEYRSIGRAREQDGGKWVAGRVS